MKLHTFWNVYVYYVILLFSSCVAVTDDTNMIISLSTCRIRAEPCYILNCAKLGQSMFSFLYFLNQWDNFPSKIMSELPELKKQLNYQENLEALKHLYDVTQTEEQFKCLLKKTVIHHWINFTTRYQHSALSLCQYHNLHFLKAIDEWKSEIHSSYSFLARCP